jgi:hypothetical protein
MNFKNYLTIEQIIYEACNRFYQGKPLEKGGTSIAGNVAPPVRELFKKGLINSGDTVLDYGAGKYGRNADWLREQGCRVYAYDPFHGGQDGWEGVSNKKPTMNFYQKSFSAYVLNVVPEYVETAIIQEVNRYTLASGKQFHITRNKDVFDSAKKALMAQNKVVGKFFIEHFAEGDEDISNYENKTLSDERIEDFCCFGYQSTRGFQRIPFLEDKGFKIVRSTSGYKIYQK